MCCPDPPSEMKNLFHSYWEYHPQQFSLHSSPFRDCFGLKKKEKEKLSYSRSNQGVPCPMLEQSRKYKGLSTLFKTETTLESYSSSRTPQDISQGLHQLLPRHSHVSFPSFQVQSLLKLFYPQPLFTRFLPPFNLLKLRSILQALLSC